MDGIGLIELISIRVLFISIEQVTGFNFVLSTMFPAATAAAAGNTALIGSHIDNNYLSKATKLKEVAKKQVKAQAEQIYQTYSVKN